ncbi:hypothetical protein BT69DRAFT_1262387 [Atractiella rhizophila]|nr:hypothetical protein BT69DRAFT_1262387 [Atractiella rhizophila]
MPKSKRQKTVHLSKVEKKVTKETKAAQFDNVRQLADQYHYIWLFSSNHFRSSFMNEIRLKWKGSRILLGRNAVFRKSLGTTEEDEYRQGVRFISNRMEGEVGLLFTDEEPDVVRDWFDSYHPIDYARSGELASQDVLLPAGTIKIEGDPAPASLEPQFRNNGLSTRLIRGAITLDNEHKVCSFGDKLDVKQAATLKLLQMPLATFQINLLTCVDLKEGKEL